MKKNNLLSISLIALTLCLPDICRAEAAPLRVYAAASLTGPLKQIISSFEKESGLTVRSNFASSGNLARQIDQGAPADVYLSASQKWMDYVEERGRIEAGSRVNPIGNAIVLIAPAGNDFPPVRFAKDFAFGQAFAGKLAIGDPNHVPAGQYAQEALSALGWWPDVAGRLIRAKDVRQAVWIVEKGEVELGTVFSSDAAQSALVQVIGTFPVDLHKPIVYAAALCKEAGSKEAARDFLDYLMQDAAQQIFAKHGFMLIDHKQKEKDK